MTTLRIAVHGGVEVSSNSFSLLPITSLVFLMPLTSLTRSALLSLIYLFLYKVINYDTVESDTAIPDEPHKIWVYP